MKKQISVCFKRSLTNSYFQYPVSVEYLVLTRAVKKIDSHSLRVESEMMTYRNKYS